MRHAKLATRSFANDHRDFIIQEIGICHRDFCLLSQRSFTDKSSKYWRDPSRSYKRGTNYRNGIAFHKLTQSHCKITVAGYRT